MPKIKNVRCQVTGYYKDLPATKGIEIHAQVPVGTAAVYLTLADHEHSRMKISLPSNVTHVGLSDDEDDADQEDSVHVEMLVKLLTILDEYDDNLDLPIPPWITEWWNRKKESVDQRTAERAIEKLSPAEIKALGIDTGRFGKLDVLDDDDDEDAVPKRLKRRKTKFAKKAS